MARTALYASFPTASSSLLTTVLLVCEQAGASAATLPAARAAAERLSAFAAPYIASGLLSSDSGASYYTFADAGLAAQARAKLSPDGSAVLVQYTSTEGFSISAAFKAFLKALKEEIADAVHASGGALSGDVTGTLPINAESSSSITLDIGRSDAVTVSLSFLLLALALRSLRLIALTFAALVAAFGGAFMLTWPLTTRLATPNFVTSLIISTLVSLSLDYSLFLLSHLKASLRAGVAMAPAVEAMLHSSGHTVVVSGATLAACFLVLGIFPVSIVRAPGIATTFAVVMSVLANLSLTPALLLTFPGFFAGAAGCTCMRARRDSADADADAAELDAAPAAPESDANAAAAGGKTARLASIRAVMDSADPWSHVAVLTQRYKYSLSIVLLALLVAPFAYRLRRFEVSQSLRNIMPRGGASVDTFYRLQALFGPAATANARIIGVAASPAHGAALTPAFFASAADAVAAALAVSAPSALTALDVYGLAWSSGAPANASLVAAAVGATAACPVSSVAACRAVCPADACSLALLAAATLSSDGRAMLLPLSLRVERTSKAGMAWANDVQAALRRASDAPGATARWHLLVDQSSDSIAYIYSRFGQLVGVTAAVIFVILLVSFRSVAIAVRAVVTLAAMEVCMFGAAAAIYCSGVLDPGGVLETFSSDQGLFWLVPILSFSLTTGLGLDYDIFLLTSVVEERMSGWSDTDAIAVGLQRSGPIISWAGLIMAVAYGGFLFSDIPLLNQLGFFVVFAVLVDTFVVRPLLVPALMAVLGRANYWPRATPAPTRGPLALLLPSGAQEEAAQAEEKAAALSSEV
jgi:uncharacterized membrane protein YdfJ with MMPL/SSD domain